MKQDPIPKSKKIVAWIGAASIALCFSAINTSAETQTNFQESINLNIQANHAGIKGLPKDKKSVNNFTHQKHANEYLKGISKHASKPFTDDFTCKACHQGSANRDELMKSIPQERLLEALNSKGGPKKVKNYFHGICLDCHKSMKKAELVTGPTKCNDCHKRG